MKYILFISTLALATLGCKDSESPQGGSPSPQNEQNETANSSPPAQMPSPSSESITEASSGEPTLDTSPEVQNLCRQSAPTLARRLFNALRVEHRRTDGFQRQYGQLRRMGQRFTGGMSSTLLEEFNGSLSPEALTDGIFSDDFITYNQIFQTAENAEVWIYRSLFVRYCQNEAAPRSIERIMADFRENTDPRVVALLPPSLNLIHCRTEHRNPRQRIENKTFYLLSYFSPNSRQRFISDTVTHLCESPFRPATMETSESIESAPQAAE
jgi:hypothetical protein